MDATPPAAAPSRAVKQWSKFFSHALATRLDSDSFESHVQILHFKLPFPPPLLAGLLLAPRPNNHDRLDPRTLQYLKSLLKLELLDTASVLRALYKYSTLHDQAQPAEARAGQGTPKKVLRWANSYESDEIVFYRLSKAAAQGTAVRTDIEALEISEALASWMTLFATASASLGTNVIDAINPPHFKEEMESARAAFVMLFISVCESQLVSATLGKPEAKVARKKLSEALNAFVPAIVQSFSEIASRLELFRSQTLANFEPVDKKKEAEEAQMFDVYDQTVGLENFQIQELPVDNSRAGLYIFLNAALVGRPLLDDSSVFTYLHNRYQGDLQSTAIALILASFDVLANAVFRTHEGAKSGLLLRSYLINRVPLLLVSFASSPFALNPSYPRFNPENCIRQALQQVDTSVFPTLSSMFDISNDSSNANTETVRQDFCFACLLHGLITKEARDDLLGEITFQELPVGGRYIKENLVQQCLRDSERLQKLISEVEGMEGNAGATCQALVEVMGQLYRNKDTMPLKQMCSQLARKPLSLDVLLLFNKLEAILHPLCELLDSWRYDDDQGEYQPVYEEFGSILLLLLAFVYRYQLSPADLRITSSDSFVAKLLTKGQVARPLEELSEQENAHISGWVHGLFDSEAGGLGDELMSSCPPQDFYLLIPTLFQQIVLAFSVGLLTDDMLRSGLEYLVEPFLLPSLVPTILYLCNHLWSDKPTDQKAVIKIFQLVLLPNAISGEASTMLSSVLNIVAEPLEHALRSYQRQDPKNLDIEPLLRALKDNIPLSRRTGSASHNEFESWANSSGAGLTASIRHTMQGLIQWSHSASLNELPTPYTHRQLILAVKMLGAKRVLSILTEELKHQTEAGGGAVAYDVVTALISAPDVTNDPSPLQPPAMPPLDESGNVAAAAQRRTTLRQALKSEAEEWRGIQKSDPGMAELVVRLYRRVEAQLGMSQEPMLQPELDLGVGVGDASLGDAIAAAAAADGAEGLSLDTSVDLGLGAAGDLGLGGSSTNSAGGLGLDDQDIFGDLTAGNEFSLEGWSDINMT